MRTLLARTLIPLAITTIAALGADNTLGTWKLNTADSKFTPRSGSGQEPDRDERGVRRWSEGDGHGRAG